MCVGDVTAASQAQCVCAGVPAGTWRVCDQQEDSGSEEGGEGGGDRSQRCQGPRSTTGATEALSESVCGTRR